MSLRVAHVNVASGYRGGERQTELLIRALAAHDVEQVLVARESSPLAQRLADVAVEVRTGSGIPLTAFRRTRGVDIVHAHEGRSVYAAWLRSIVSGTPYVVTRRVNNPLGTGVLTRSAYLRASCVACVAADIKRIVSSYDARIRTCVIHSSSSGLLVDPAAARAIRDRHAGKWLIGNVAALDNAQKGQEYIIEVARELSGSHPNLQFVLVGGGDDEDLLKEMAGALPNVTFTGFVDNVGDYLAAFDVFILPSNKEGIGGILLDAMDQSLPVIASRVGGLPEIVHNGDNGLLIEPRKSEQLRQAIIKLYDDPDLCGRLGAAGKSFAGAFTPAAMAEQYLQLYAAALRPAA
jgi:glycosyltransferase involved in cell wall biosynthesis